MIPSPRSEASVHATRFQRSDWYSQRQELIAASEAWASNRGIDPEQAAQSVCAYLLRQFWDQATGNDRDWLPRWNGPPFPPLPLLLRHECRSLCSTLRGISDAEVGYRIGGLYTALLPVSVRGERGAFYTPPELAERLLDLAATEGVDWAESNVLDPACGGGAFLVPVAHRILTDHRIIGLDAELKLRELESRLAGIEIDGFAAWMTRTLLRLLTFDLCRTAQRPLQVEIRIDDAMKVVLDDERTFDLVVGNPPYGRVQLSSEQREEFGRSLYGHANLYGLFLDAALRWRGPTGLIAFVTPTSFLGGRYFHRLRRLLLDEAPPLVVDILSERTGIFDSVQQETCLTLFGPTRTRDGTIVHHLQLKDGELSVQRSGAFSLTPSGVDGHPWLLPRSPSQAPLIKAAGRTTARLHDLGYKASTGPLVWNRHKGALRGRAGSRTFPLVWAEAVRANQFDFNYRSRAHAPYVAVDEGKGHLLETRPGVLVQRTTAKEQHRRLIACSIPEEFLRRWKALVIENHVNVLRPTSARPVAPEILAAVLNCRIVDEVFRCLSGTVAVSATELHALPLPSLDVFRELERLVGQGPLAAVWGDFEHLVAESYGFKSDTWTG